LDNYQLFKECARDAAESFKKIDKRETIRVISHLDSDGICAASILLYAFMHEGRKYSLSIVQQVNELLLLDLHKEPYKNYFFTDLGSGQFSKIARILKDKEIFILDHHELDSQQKQDNIIHINPHLFGINGSKEISGSGVVYLFCSYLNDKYRTMAYVALIGAIGDVQENQGFMKLNNEILDEALKQHKIEVKRGLKFFGQQTRPIHKILEYSADPYIPDVTGSESGAFNFLAELGIHPKHKKAWKRMIDLSDEDMQKLVAGIIMKRFDEENPEDILGNVYILSDEKIGSPFKDAKEFSTLLNACGRLNKPSLGIGVCLGDPKLKKKAIQHMNSYKREIVKAMNWYEQHKSDDAIIKGDGFIIINAKKDILSTMIGTVASIISKSKEFEEGTYIMSLAQDPYHNTKVSLRISGKNKNVDVKRLMVEITSHIPDAEAGGHKEAAGAIISTQHEDKFIEIAQEILRKNKL
jgi:single-stranded-DNA-specific exonuclease